MACSLLASAEAIEVKTLTDQLDVPAGPQTSLREAIRDASAGDTITFSPALNGGTITLALGEMAITKNLTIDASALANGITIDANSSSRIFQVSDLVSLTLNNLSLTNGSGADGGAIFLGDSTTLDVQDCNFSTNTSSRSGGAVYIFDSGTLTFTDYTFSSNECIWAGGAVYASGLGARNVTLVRCQFTSNHAENGGGLYVSSSTIQLTDCLFENNGPKPA